MRRYRIYRRTGSGLRPLMMIIFGVIIFAQFGAMRLHQLRQAQQLKQPKTPVIYDTQMKCEAKSGKSCDFVTCDYIPPGKTSEEVCGGAVKGWQPVEDPAAPAGDGGGAK